MGPHLVSEDKDFITIRIPKNGETMLESKDLIQEVLNEAGKLATAAILKRFDTNGEPIFVQGVKLTSMGQINKIYQTPYIPAAVKRHIYQTSSGGKTYCPLEKGAKIIITSTPKFAKMVSSKFSAQNARDVIRDLPENHSRPILLSIAQNILPTWSGFLPRRLTKRGNTLFQSKRCQ